MDKPRIERSSDRDRGFTKEYIKARIEERKRQLAIPGFREREERERRAAAAKLPKTKFPELAKSTKPALVGTKRSTNTTASNKSANPNVWRARFLNKI